jgi:NAD-dependent dihydropyrimidine dehydrogenase PreA subunit
MAPGIFAGGDAATGPASVIEAIAAGQRAAASIDRFLGGAGDLARFDAPPRPAEPGDPAPRGSARLAPATLPPAERLGGFRLVEERCDAAQATAEAARCLSCDRRFFSVRVDPTLCKSCGYCDEVCGPGVFARTDAFNEGGFHPYAATNEEACVGCLACLYVCPDFAVTIY